MKRSFFRARFDNPPYVRPYHAYLFILPGLAIYVLFVLWPILNTARYSLFDWTGFSEPVYIGFDNYRELWNDGDFWLALRHNAFFVIFFSILPIILALFLTSLMTRGRLRGMAIFRSGLFIPQVMSSVVVGIIWRWLFAYDGPINEFLILIGLESWVRPWLGDFTYARYAVGSVGTWVQYGLCMVLFIAGAQSINEDLYDAARVAGPLWLAVGAVVYLVSRRIAGAGLLETTTPPVPDLVAGETRPVGRILVPLKLGGIGEEVMATALRLARETDAAVDVVHVVKVPMALPLDADLGAGREREAREEIDDAREIAGELGVAIEGRVVRARALAEAIVAEAVATGADLVVMGSSPRWRRHTRFFSPTVDEVLRRASCEVMVVAYPEGVIDDDLDMGQAPADEGRP
jgi:nucleotide-binding universal stress UspA family protein/ABC-type spermidine/putrescine transport system permease subunit II